MGQTFLNLLNGYHFLKKSSPLGIGPSLEGLLLCREMQKYCKTLDICGNQNFAVPKNDILAYFNFVDHGSR